MRADTDPGWSAPGHAAPELPGNIEAEEALLGALLLNNAHLDRVVGFLTGDHFAVEANAMVYEAIKVAAAEGRRADPITLRDHIPGTIGDETAAQLLARLASGAVGVSVIDYARAIVDGSLRRSLVLIGEDIALCAREVASVPIADQLDDAEQRLTEVRALHGRGGAPVGSAEAWDRHETDRFSGSSTVRTYPWLFPQIGAALDGDMEPGNLYGLLGASGDAKTSLTLQIIVHMASLGVPALFLSGEQSDAQCRDQIYAQQLGVLAKDIKRNRVSDAEYARIREFKAQLKQLPIRIEEWPEEPASGISRRVRAFCRQHDRGCFFAVDHASNIAPDNPKDIWVEQIRKSIQGVKRLCAETGSIGLILMHRGSDFLSRRRMRPVRGDVFGKESALKPLDGCFAIFRPAKWLREAASIADVEKVRQSLEDEAVHFHSPGSPTELAEIYSLKTRFGQEGMHQTRASGSPLLFEGRYTRFVRPNKPAQVDMLDEPEGYT